MYVVFFGSDRSGVRDAATKYIDENMPENASFITLSSGEYQLGQVADYLGASSLFGEEEWFLFDTPSYQEEFKEEVESSLKEIAESKNTFIILEDSLLAASKKTLAKHATEINEYKADKKDRFNSFVLAEALANRDKRRFWILLQEAKLEGLRNEEIIGILWWQLKSMRLAQVTKSATEAGMKQFPYNKAKQALVKFREGEVEKLSQSLLELYHDGHAGLKDMDNSLEQWVLGV